jgi:hypothetical protein
MRETKIKLNDSECMIRKDTYKFDLSCQYRLYTSIATSNKNQSLILKHFVLFRFSWQV